MIVFIILGIIIAICIGLLIYVVIKIAIEDLETHMIARRRRDRNRLARSVQTRIELILQLSEQRRIQPLKEIEMTPINHIIVINPGNRITLGSEYVYKEEGE
tara:strand:- start:101 stop:406 length:306 start_codon:yes stop_codon:yes gene_type:complete